MFNNSIILQVAEVNPSIILILNFFNKISATLRVKTVMLMQNMLILELNLRILEKRLTISMRKLFFDKEKTQTRF